MSDYKLEIVNQSWRHLNSTQLAQHVQQLADLGYMFNVERETEPKPAPEIVVKTVETHHNYYVCPEKGCFYTSSSRRGLANHRRIHK